MLATIPAPAQTAPTSDQKQGEQKQGDQKLAAGSIHGALTTTQADDGSGSGGLAGISVQLAAQPPDGGPLTADTDDAGH